MERELNRFYVVIDELFNVFDYSTSKLNTSYHSRAHRGSEVRDPYK